MTTESFIAKMIDTHGDVFDYSKSVYTHNREKITLICKRCNETFMKHAGNALAGRGCPKCLHKTEYKLS